MRSDGHTNARTHASVTTGCSGRVESGLCSSTFSLYWEGMKQRVNLDLGAPGRCSPARDRASLAASFRRKSIRGSVSGFGQHTREVRSYRAVSLHFVSCCRSRTTTSRPKKLALLDDAGERGLAQSGRPRRAKRRRTASRGGKIAGSSTRKTGARKGIAGLSASSRWKASRVVEAVLSSRGGWEKRSRPSWISPSRERGGKPARRRRRQRWAARKLSKARPVRWTKPTAGSASGSLKRVARRETHQAPKSRAQARRGR